MSCSPNLKKKSYTCYTLEDLKKIAKNYNKIEDTKNKIDLKKYKSKKSLHNAIIKANYDKCENNEFCWLKQNYMTINKDINNFLVKFRPAAPNSWKENPTKWLDTINLLNVMKQYDDKYKDFKFLGVYPIDFNTKLNTNRCVSNTMCNLNIKDLVKNKIYKLGNIFNLDKHYQSGSHWVSLFVNLNPNSKNKGCYYYDSAGVSAPFEVRNLVNKITQQYKELTNHDLKFHQNTTRHQLKNSECGIFSLYFMDQSLKNISFNKFLNKKNLNDNYMLELRKTFFNRF